MTRIFHWFFYVKDGSQCQASTSVLCLITAQRQYTAVQKMRTPLKYLSLHNNLILTGFKCTAAQMKLQVILETKCFPWNLYLIRCIWFLLLEFNQALAENSTIIIFTEFKLFPLRTHLPSKKYKKEI